jgi:uncharacterized protein (TIGR03663 family)
MKQRAVYAGLLAVVVVGALLLRVSRLERRPMHHDEANQAVRCGILQRTGLYTYDPRDHHGPVLYYFSLPSVWLSAGRDFSATSEGALRIVTVLFGVGTLLLLYLAADGLGRPATLAAGVLTALSPALTYYSRFYIQETLFVFFIFGAICAGWRCLQRPSIFWAVLAGVFVGLMHATKETCLIAYGAMAVGSIPAFVAERRRAASGAGRKRIGARHVVAAVVAAAAVSVLFFSSFLTNLNGPLDSVRAFGGYVEKGMGKTDHLHPWYYYLRILTYVRAGGMVWSEGLIVALGVAGIAAVLSGKGFEARDAALARFLVLYTLFTAAVYSLIPYKTPWNMLSFLHGLVLLAGIGAVALFKLARHRPARAVLVLLLAACTWQLARQNYRANYRYGADSRNPYAYVHTSTDIFKLAGRIDDIAAIHPQGKAMLIKVVTNAYDMWPLPWYLRAFDNVGYWTETGEVPWEDNAPIVVASTGKMEDVGKRLGDAYQSEWYGLRPNVFLVVYIRGDLWRKFLQTRT